MNVHPLTESVDRIRPCWMQYLYANFKARSHYFKLTNYTLHIYIQNIRGNWIGAWLILWWKIGYKVMQSCSDYNCKLVALGGSTRGIGRAKSPHKFSHYSSIVAKFRKFEKVENRRASCSVVSQNSCNFLKFLSMLFVTDTCNQFFWLNLPKGA